jgi:hypothetical protein
MRVRVIAQIILIALLAGFVWACSLAIEGHLADAPRDPPCPQAEP